MIKGEPVFRQQSNREVPICTRRQVLQFFSQVFYPPIIS